MSNTPSKAEIEALVKRHGATSYRNRADTQHPAYGFPEDGLNGLIDEVLAKWGTPQPVAREPLTDAQIAEMMRDTWGCASIAPRHALEFARAIETEVRKQDEALIRQLVDAADPLQGAANWLAEAHGQFSPVVLSGCLMIGYNRAKRLHDAALAARKQGASQ